jgi:hypothetical protein
MEKTVINKETKDQYIVLPSHLITTSDEFRKYHNILLQKYNVTFKNNVDYPSFVTGNIYEKGDDFICHITGICYDEAGNWNGDLDGYLRMLEDALYEMCGNLKPQLNQEK